MRACSAGRCCRAGRTAGRTAGWVDRTAAVVAETHTGLGSSQNYVGRGHRSQHRPRHLLRHHLPLVLQRIDDSLPFQLLCLVIHSPSRCLGLPTVGPGACWRWNSRTAGYRTAAADAAEGIGWNSANTHSGYDHKDSRLGHPGWENGRTVAVRIGRCRTAAPAGDTRRPADRDCAVGDSDHTAAAAVAAGGTTPCFLDEDLGGSPAGGAVALAHEHPPRPEVWQIKPRRSRMMA